MTCPSLFPTGCRLFLLVLAVFAILPPGIGPLSGAVVATGTPSTAAGRLALHARSWERLPDGAENGFQVVQRELDWDPRQTAIVVCDMWDRHWCAGATARVAEMAPRMNAVLKAARDRGVLIIHAPSDTLNFYADWPQRKRAQAAPPAPAPTGVGQWKSLDRDKEPPLPIDDSDGGCDDDPPCAQGNPWRRQIATLEIADQDVISDRGDEVFNLLEQAGIKNVIVLGVHTNMCVLGRPFSIRAMVGLGKNVVLMRDLTDTMYNSRRRPVVSHFTGTDLVVDHIEKHWCPTITSADFLGGDPFQFAADRRSTVAMVIGENEYRTWLTLPAFAREELLPRNLRMEFVLSSTNLGDPRFSNWPALRRASLVVVSTRRRGAPREMIESLRAHLDAGRPLIGLRTASHGFAVRGNDAERLKARPDLADWEEFDATVLGGNYQGHHGADQLPSVVPPAEAREHPILDGIDGFTAHGSLYRTSPLRPAARALLVGTIPDRAPEPVAWTHRYGPNAARIFYTSLGQAGDFREPQFRRLLLNAVHWALASPGNP